MGFFYNAIKMQLMITEFLLKDFGVKDRRRNLEFAKDVYNLKEETTNNTEDIMSAYELIEYNK